MRSQWNGRSSNLISCQPLPRPSASITCELLHTLLSAGISYISYKDYRTSCHNGIQASICRPSQEPVILLLYYEGNSIMVGRQVRERRSDQFAVSRHVQPIHDQVSGQCVHAFKSSFTTAQNTSRGQETSRLPPRVVGFSRGPGSRDYGVVSWLLFFCASRHLPTIRP